MATTITKSVHLSEARAKRLGQLASKKRTTEDAVIAQALDMLFDLNVDLESDHERASSKAPVILMPSGWQLAILSRRSLCTRKMAPMSQFPRCGGTSLSSSFSAAI